MDRITFLKKLVLPAPRFFALPVSQRGSSEALHIGFNRLGRIHGADLHARPFARDTSAVFPGGGLRPTPTKHTSKLN